MRHQIAPLFGIAAVQLNSESMSPSEAIALADRLLEAASEINRRQEFKKRFLETVRHFRAAARADITSSIDSNQSAQADPANRTIFSCNQNVKIVTEPGDRFAHIEVSPGGIGCDPVSLRELATTINTVADSLDPPANSNTDVIHLPENFIMVPKSEIVQEPDGTVYYKQHKQDMEGHGQRGFGYQLPENETVQINCRPTSYMVVDLNGPTLEYLGESISQALKILTELDLPPQCLLASVPEVVERWMASK